LRLLGQALIHSGTIDHQCVGPVATHCDPVPFWREYYRAFNAVHYDIIAQTGGFQRPWGDKPRAENGMPYHFVLF
jgi:hypothetical protein